MFWTNYLGPKNFHFQKISDRISKISQNVENCQNEEGIILERNKQTKVAGNLISLDMGQHFTLPTSNFRKTTFDSAQGKPLANRSLILILGIDLKEIAWVEAQIDSEN